jgi:hypothetical protein
LVDDNSVVANDLRDQQLAILAFDIVQQGDRQLAEAAGEANLVFALRPGAQRGELRPLSLVLLFQVGAPQRSERKIILQEGNDQRFLVGQVAHELAEDDSDEQAKGQVGGVLARQDGAHVVEAGPQELSQLQMLGEHATASDLRWWSVGRGLK